MSDTLVTAAPKPAATPVDALLLWRWTAIIAGVFSLVVGVAILFAASASGAMVRADAEAIARFAPAPDCLTS